MIMGYTAMGAPLETAPISEVKNITVVTLSNAAYDDLYAVRMGGPPSFEGPPPALEEWTENTFLHARFDGDIYCGNTDFGVNNTTNLLVKRRKKGEFQWMTLFDIPAVKVEDYEFTVHDPYAPIGTLEYAVVPIINGYESEYSITEIEYDFDGLLLIERDRTIWTLTDIVISEEKNSQIGVCNTIFGKYPYIFQQGENDYFTGTLSATFIEPENHRLADTGRFHRHYAEVLEFLNDRKPKILKYDDGRIRLISVTSPPTDVADEHRDKHTISFRYAEIGSVDSNQDMNSYGFLDVGEQWWRR